MHGVTSVCPLIIVSRRSLARLRPCDRQVEERERRRHSTAVLMENGSGASTPIDPTTMALAGQDILAILKEESTLAEALRALEAAVAEPFVVKSESELRAGMMSTPQKSTGAGKKGMS